MLEGVYARIQAHYGGTELVPGEGRPDADILLLGEAPGKDEVAQGRPFCGKAGQNLNAFLQAIELARADIYITNVCKFRPTKTSEKGRVSNRPPTRAEVVEALPFLYEEILAVNPRCIVTLGNTPLRACMGTFTPVIGDHHGKVTHVDIHGTSFPLFALYHPASIIYNQSLKQTYAQDLAALREYIISYE